MALDEVADVLRNPSTWRHEFGAPESPVVIAAADVNTAAICSAIRNYFCSVGNRLFIVGPPGSGKSAFISALLADGEIREVKVRLLAPRSTDASDVLWDLARSNVDILVVNRFDQLSLTVRNGIVEHRGKCRLGLLATAERLTAVTAAALSDSRGHVVNVPALEGRPRDILAISQLLWPGICGGDSSFLEGCSAEAIESLAKGPFPSGVTSLRALLEQLADALVTSGALSGGEFHRLLDARDIAVALVSALRAEHVSSASTPLSAAVVVEGRTDVVYLTAAARLAQEARGWRLLEGCDLVAAGDERHGGAAAVWRRLFELTAQSAEAIGLFDNDDVGRRELAMARKQNLRAELLPAEFDRLRLADECRSLEIEDLLCVRVLERFYQEHPQLTAEEVRVRFGTRRRIAPQGKDKETLAAWAAREMRLEDCERLIYLLCYLRRRVGLPVPREGLDAWLKELVKEDC
jgi:hypothetical protein